MRSRLSLFAAGLLLALAGPAAAEPKITWKKTVLDTQVPLRGRGRRRRQQGRQDRRAQRRVLVRGPGLEAARDAAVQGPRDGPGQLQPVVRLLGRRLQRRRLPGPDRHRLPRRPVLLDGEPEGRADGHWKKHEIWHTACNETPLYADLFGTGKRVLVMGCQPKGRRNGNEGQMAYFTPAEGPDGRVGDAPDQRAEHARAGRRCPGRAGSATAWASATSTATAGTT